MIVNVETTKKNLRHLLEREACRSQFKISKELKEDFIEACKKFGIGKYSVVLEDLIEQVNENYFSKGKALTVEVEKLSDRQATSINCDAETWKAFDVGCEKNKLAMADVLEALMTDFIFQVRKK